jgi:hypothetical protein
MHAHTCAHGVWWQTSHHIAVGADLAIAAYGNLKLDTLYVCGGCIYVLKSYL